MFFLPDVRRDEFIQNNVSNAVFLSPPVPIGIDH